MECSREGEGVVESDRGGEGSGGEWGMGEGSGGLMDGGGEGRKVMKRWGGGGKWWRGRGVVEGEGEGWEWWGLMERDGGDWWRVLDLTIVCCCLLVARQGRHASLLPHRHVSWPCCCCCPCAVLLLLACSGPVLCLNEVGWGEGGTGGTYLASTTMSDGCRLSFWLPRRCWRHGTCIPHSHGRWFPSVGGRFHLWAVICIRSQSFAFIALISICLHLWLVVYICGQSFAFVGGRFCCILWLVVGTVSWLSQAALFCGHCGGWWKKGRMSHIVTFMWCLNSHARSHE